MTDATAGQRLIAAAKEARDGKVSVAYEPRNAPERVWLDYDKTWGLLGDWYGADNGGAAEYVRQDLHAAVVAERDALAARVAVLGPLAKTALEGWRSWVNDQLQGTRAWDDAIAEVNAVEAAINAALATP